MGGASSMPKTVTLAVVAITLLLLPACGARRAEPVRGPATTTGNTAAQSSGGTSPDIAGTVVALGASFTPTPVPTPAERPSEPINIPAGPAERHGVILNLSELMLPLDELRDRSRVPGPEGFIPYGLLLGDKLHVESWHSATAAIGQPTVVSIEPGTQVFREEVGRVVPATPHDLETGQRIAARLINGFVDLSPKGTADLVVIREGAPERLTPRDWPEEIYSLAPRQGEPICPGDRVSVTMRLHEAGRKDGLADPSRFMLVIDGKDVAATVMFLGTTDLPQSKVELRSRKGLGLGRHTASITFPLENGWMRTYTWTFKIGKTYEHEPGVYLSC